MIIEIKDIVEMNLCEQEIIFLNPYMLYKFTVNSECKRCLEIEKITENINGQTKSSSSPF